MLGLGRALGETMAVALVLSRAVISFALLTSEAPTLIAANIALNFPESYGLGVFSSSPPAWSCSSSPWR